MTQIWVHLELTSIVSLSLYLRTRKNLTLEASQCLTKTLLIINQKLFQNKLSNKSILNHNSLAGTKHRKN
jgi:hypothetical protein